MPAEWAAQSAVLLSWPHINTDWAYMLDEVKSCFYQIAKAIVAGNEQLIIVTPEPDAVMKELHDIDNGNIRYFEMQTNDTWARDFGAVSVLENGENAIIDFKFNAWGLKFAADKDNLINSKLYNAGLFNAKYHNALSFVLEGGSIESDGKGTILTTEECLLSKNRNGSLDKAEIETELKKYLGAKRVLWLSHGALAGDDTDSHVDTLARLCDENTIAYVKCNDVKDEHYEDLAAMEAELKDFRTEDGKPYNLVALPMAGAVYDEDGMRIPATYANFLIMNNRVLVPIYNQKENDDKALEILSKVFPDRVVIGIDCNALIKQHGSLHCVTMQFPAEFINEVK